MIYLQLFYIFMTLALARKDADSYLLKAPDNGTNVLTNLRVKRWHIDGVILAIGIMLPLLFLGTWWKVIITCVLIRLSFFDIAFNTRANLGATYLGSTAAIDKFFIKIFNKEGAIAKALVFLGLLIGFNIITHFK